MKKKKEIKVQKRSSFEKAVMKTPNVSTGYKAGLQAFEKDHSKKVVADSKKIDGSLFIDKCLEKIDNGNRWDYAFSYESKVYFVEVHSANSSEVSVVIKKLNWLKNWLHHSAPEINKLKSKDPFHWLQSGKFDIPKGSRHYKIAEQSGIFPKRSLTLK